MHTIAVQLITAFDTNSVIHPRQQQYILSVAGLYLSYTYSDNLLRQAAVGCIYRYVNKCCYTLSNLLINAYLH